jgi:hypothetical protein
VEHIYATFLLHDPPFVAILAIASKEMITFE